MAKNVNKTKGFGQIKDVPVIVPNDNTASIDGNISGKCIVIRSEETDLPQYEYHYLVDTNGVIANGSLESNENIHILVKGGRSITWTQITPLCKFIQQLQTQGAGKVKRYDEIDKTNLNPIFNLNHCLIKYGIK